MTSSDSPALAPPTAVWTSILALFLGVFATSFAAIFVRISEVELGPCGTIFNRFWIATLTLGLWLGIQRWRSWQSSPTEPPVVMTPRDWGLVGLAGVITAFDLQLLAYALSQTSVANATVLSDLSPFFTTLGAWLILKQLFDHRFLLGLGLALVGVLVIACSDFQLAAGQLRGDEIAILSAMTWSAYLLTIGQLRTRLSTSTVLFWTSAIAALVTAGSTWVLEGQLFPVSVQGWGAVVGLGLISQTLGQGLTAFSLNQVSASLAALMFLLEPIMAAVGAWVLFSESLSLLNAIAFAIVLMGIYVAISSPTALKESP